ncbi:hypothetical protein Acr_20g0000210 [Actinidia rufa]|uniref:Uncharacterized protein n=1 Tax=Actinidia rufa TaxID=165716 RepID=A0A7J0GBQ4_9ERIC|nr:hypothetical protein Acr_20g0000210 [Actinidia rufa]
MDKNKNRTDLLAAGRKRLQQFRQKKDSKGSKSSGKAGKSERDSDADAAPDVANPAAALLQVPDAEVRPVHESDAVVVDSSVTLLRDSSQSADMYIATIDPLSVVVVPETGSVTTTLADNVELQSEDSGVDEATRKLSVGKEQDFDSLVSYQVDSTHTVNTEGDLGSVVSETNSVYLDTPIGIDSSTPPDLDGSSKPVAIAVEAEYIHGADQGADCLALKQVDRSIGIDLEGDSVPDLPGLGGGAESCARTVSGETNMKELTIEVDQANALNDVSASAGEANEVKEVWTEEEHSVSAQPLPESLGSSAVKPEVAVHQREDLVSPFFNEEKSEIPSAEWVEADIQGEEVGVEEGFSMFKGHSEERLLEGKMVRLSSDAGIILISLSQIVEVLRRFDEEEFRLLLTAKESAANANFRSTGISTNNAELQSSSQSVVPDYQFSDVLLELQMEFDCQHKQLLEEMSTASTLVSEVRGRNESLTEELAKYKSELQATVCAKDELEKQLHTAKAEVVEISTRADDLNVELKRKLENTILNGSLISAVEETKKLAEEKGYLALGNDELLTELSELHVELKRSCGKLSSMSMELADCSDLVAGLQVENAILNGSLTSAVEETKKLAEEKGYLVLGNEKRLTELSECKDSLASLQVENLNLSGSLALTTKDIINLEEVKENFVRENEKLSTDLAECKALLESLHEENANLNGSLTSVTEERNKLIEEKGHLVSENEKLSMQLADVKSLMESIKVEHLKAVDGLNDSILRLEQLTEENIKLSSRSVEDVNQLEGSDMPSRGLECATAADDTPRLPRKGESELIYPLLRKPDAGLLYRETLEEADKIIQKLENAIEGMHSHSVSLSKSSGKMVKPGVSKLIQAFESKAHQDDHDADYVPSTENQLLVDSFMFTKEQTRNLRAVLKELLLDTENASVLFKGERDCRIQADAALGELKFTYEALKEHNNSSEAANLELIVLYEFIKQHLCDIGAKKGELLAMYGALRQQSIVLEAENSKLVKKACQVEALHKEVSERALILEQQWDSTVAQVVLTIGKLDSLIEVIEDLREKLEASSKDHEAMCNTYKDMTEKFNDLHVKNELAIGVLHRIYGNLRKLVNDSCGHVEQRQVIEVNENLLDPLHHGNYDTLMEQLAVFLGERLQFKSVNSKLNSELIDKAKDMEVLKKRGFESDTILKLVEDVEGAIKLESTGIDSDKLESRLQALIYFLFQKYKEAEEQVSLSKETNFCKELELSELQGQIDHLSILIVQHENESLILKESMRQGAEHLVVVQSELHDKVNELEQSEQRKHSNELEKCSQELQLKDARLQEVETKLKTYSEAGERVEALESELSYIRNSATALRESFILKDSVLQRIEEILEDLELPEHFHSRDIIEKVDWLARSVTGNSLPLTDWDLKSSVGGGSYSDTGFVSMDAWKEDTHPNSNSADDLRRKYEELQSKFYGLAEQNEMLEQSLMERNNVVQRWEDILERINIPLQLRSMEPEDRIEWLGSALSEAQQHCDGLQRKVYNFETYCDSLQRKVDNLETYCATLTTDLEESQKRLSDLEAALQAVIREKEHLSESLDILTCDYDKVSEKAIQFEVNNDKLQNEVTALKDKLVEKVGNQDHIEHIEGEITRLEKLVSDVLQNSDTDDGVSGGSSTECLERILRKLVEKYTSLSSEKPSLVYSVDEQTTEKAGAILEDKRDSEGSEEQDLAVLKKELEDALHDLMCVKEERDRYMENNQSLTREVESLVMKRQELQELLSQEEQKSVSVREKLNVAVRKGKSLVQQRDSLKQTIEEVNNEVERLKSEINNRESSLSDYELKIKHLSTYQERVGLLESESLFLKNRLAETEYSLHEKTHILNLILNALNDNDTGLVFNISDPVEKLEQIGNQWRNLHAAVASSENDIRKSKRAAELLLAELNERKLLSAKLFHDLKNYLLFRFEERNNQFAELMVLKSCVDQLMKDFFDINDLLADILSKDLEYLHNLEVNMISCLDPSEALGMVGQPLGGPRSITSANAENKETFLATSSLLDLKMQERIDDSNFVEIVILLGHQLQVFMKEIGCHKESLYKHLIALDEGAKHVSGVAGVVRREVTSQKQSCESMKENIIRLECIEKEKDTESIVMRRNISLLYEACSSSVMEIENWKSQFVGNDLAATDMGLNSGSSISLDGWKLFSDQTLLSSDDNIRTMADKLLSAVKDFICIQAKIVGGGQKEMKTTISNLQRELQEKDIQKDRICVELVSQIKEAEATASSYLQDFQSAKAKLYDSERRLEVMEEERNTLEQRVKELQDGEATLKDLDERVRSLNDALAAKEQEIEVLMQALDEEETQMEELTNKIGELERVVQQKNVGMENLEASRGKVMKKLSVTVSKFDELHHLSASLLSEVEKLQSQLQERDTEISFLRQEVTRCTNDALVASQMSNKRNSDEIQDLLTWLDTMISGLQLHDVHFDDQKREQVHEYKEMFQKHIMCLVSELEDLREVVQSRDMLLQVERSKVEELTRKGESLENSLREKESQLTGHQGVGDSGQTGSMTSEITEVQPVINKWVPPGTSITPQVRSLRKVNNDQVAIAIDMEPGSDGRLDDEDDDKAHGFKSLTTSRIVPRFTRPVTDMIDDRWVSCDRALMRQPALRLGVIIYWALLHTLLATFVV